VDTIASETPSSCRRLAEAVSAWLRSGGTRDPTGGYCGWRTKDGTLSPPYPEITGYMLTFLANEALTGPEMVTANAAANWLANRVEAGDFAGRPNEASRIVYPFDVGMIAHGLFAFGARSADDRLIDAGRIAARFLIERLIEDGRLPSQIPDHVTAGRPATWSSAGDAHLAKVSQALLRAAEFDVPGAGTAADILMERFVAAPSTSDGRPIRTVPGDGPTSLHAACYAAEGLWIWSVARDCPPAAQRAWHIADWVWRTQLPDGGFTGYADDRGIPLGDHRQSDVLAQAVRLAYVLGLRPPGLARAIDALEQSVWWYSQSERAAVLYWPQAERWHGNCWSSLFAVQALRLHGSTDPEILNWRQFV
jgi:hypothetical protein